MNKQVLYRLLGIALTLMIVAMLAFVVSAQDSDTEATDVDQEALIERGEYIANIAGCISCHTTPKEEYSDMEALTLDQALTVSLRALESLDTENKAYAGGRAFPLGPMGVILSPNITPHEETGIGSWTDEEIEAALRIGINANGRRLFPLMPYRNYFNMAEEDMDALIAFLRSLEPVENEVPKIGPTGDGIAPDLVASDEVLISAPDGEEDLEVLGDYLVNTVMSCGDCHTPLDETTGEPILDEWLAGGQPWEGPWGIVYGGNITPHNTTGIGTWTEADIAKAIREGVRVDGRRLILMPWEDYVVLTEQDMDAIVAYLQAIPAVDNEVPANSIDPSFIIFEEE